MADVRGCEFPDDLSYDQELNVWFKDVGAGRLEAGLTAFGLALVGDLYMFNPRPVGREIEEGKAFALVEVAKTVLSVRAPFACEVLEINEPLVSTPTKISRSPYMNWLSRLAVQDMTAAQTQLLKGTDVSVRANALMDLHQMTSFADFKPNQGA